MCYVIFELREISSHCIIEKKDIDIKNIVTNNKGVENEEECQEWLSLFGGGKELRQEGHGEEDYLLLSGDRAGAECFLPEARHRDS